MEIRRARQHHGFTIVELLVVVTLITILLALLIPMVGVAREQSMTLQCRSHLHALGEGCLAYAATADGRLPGGDASQYQGNWEWDLSRTQTYQIMGVQNEQQALEGNRRNIFYCPFVLDRQDPDGLWEFTDTFRVTGYFWMITRNYSSIPVPILPKCWKDSISRRNLVPQDTELALDVVMSQGADNFYRVYGGWYLPHTTSHIRGTTPLGSNIMFLDGRVEWRPYSAMQPRTSSNPTFWY